MVTDLKVQKATREEALRVAELSSEVAKEGTIREFKPEDVMELLSSEQYYVVVAKLSGEVVGYAMSTYSWGKLHILDVAVEKRRRRMGIGKTLIQHLIHHALEKSIPEAYCEVKARNIPALNLFTRLGFRFKIFSTLVAGGFYGLYLSIPESLRGFKRPVAEEF